MKRLVALAVVGLTLAATLSQVHAQQNPDDQYVIIYGLMQRADSLNRSGQPSQALAQYTEVQDDLRKFQKAFPDWNPRIVNFRLNYLAAKITEVTAQLPAAPQNATPAPKAPANATPVQKTAAPATPGAAAPATAADWEAQLGALREQVQKFRTDNETLQARLKEALAAQPAAVDPRELTRARDQIRQLMKENDLLKISLSQGKIWTAAGTSGAGSGELKMAKQALAEVNQKLALEIERANKLALDNQALQVRIKDFLASPEAMEALRQENELLKKQVADLNSASLNPAGATRLNSELASARAKLAEMESAAGVNFLEKAALENRVRQLQAAVAKSTGPSPSARQPSQAENEARIRALTDERNDLLAKLGQANQELHGRKKSDTAAQIRQLTDEVEVLRARLAVDEAQAIPYTPGELALFKQSPPLLANPDAEKKSIRELPGGAAMLVAEAQRYFNAKQYDKAADNYREILRRDEGNPLALGNLAAIELEQNNLDAAEKHINQAVTQNPDDAYNLAILGYLKFRQEKYDAALNALSRAAKLDPQNPEIENYLGVTLSHKGMRGPAETALRKAIQLSPGYGPAHNNLAVIYVSQQPPLAGLARWHYQKALEDGQPRNPELEKVLKEKGAPVNLK